MPTLPTRPCTYPGCGQIRCTLHSRATARQYDQRRGTAHQRGYDARWQRVRLAVLIAEPLCRHCAEIGIATPANEVDHITPLSRGGERLATWNLQPLCHPCHARKTRRDMQFNCQSITDSRGGLNLYVVDNIDRDHPVHVSCQNL